MHGSADVDDGDPVDADEHADDVRSFSFATCRREPVIACCRSLSSSSCGARNDDDDDDLDDGESSRDDTT